MKYNIYLRKDGRYEGRISRGVTDGRRTYQYFFGRSKAEVMKKMNDFRRESAQYEICEVTLADLFHEWFEQIRYRIKESTAANYRMKANKHILPAFGELHICDISSEDICRFIGQKQTDGLSDQKRVNRGEYPSYFQTDHHEGIISHEVFAMAQRILKTEKYRQKAQMQSFEPAVVQKGLLKGFIPLHQFSAVSNYQEYQALCASVKWCEEAVSSIEIPNVTDFYRLRSEYGCRHQAVRLTLTGRKIECSQRLFELMHGVEYFELLLHPEEYLLAIRKTDSSNPNAIHWASWADGCCKRLKGAVGSISESIFDLMNWERDWKFICEGHCRTRNGETILLFALMDTVAYVPVYDYDERTRQHKRTRWNAPIFPEHWRDSIYGDNDAESATKCRLHLVDYFGIWDIDAKAEPVREQSRPVTQHQNTQALALLHPQTAWERISE